MALYDSPTLGLNKNGLFTGQRWRKYLHDESHVDMQGFFLCMSPYMSSHMIQK